MEKKHSLKKMTLSKETLRLIDGKQLDGVAGNISGSVCGWDTCYQICQGTKYC